MNRSVRLLWTALTLFMPGTLAASQLALLGVGEQSTPAVTQGSSSSAFAAKNGLGVGIQFTATLSKRVELELGASYTQRAWNDSLAGDLLMPAIDLPAGLRLRIFRFWALELGGYYSSINAGSRVSGTSTVDWGVYAGTQILIPLSAKGAILCGARYLYGLANVSLDTGDTGKLSFRTFQAQLGYQFNLSGN